MENLPTDVQGMLETIRTIADKHGVADAPSDPSFAQMMGAQNTKLLEAVSGGSLDKVRAALKEGANPNDLNQRLNGALVPEAAAVGNKILPELVKSGLDTTAGQLSGLGIVYAAAGGHVENVQILMPGADPAAKNTAMIVSMNSGNEQITNLLSKNGAEPDAGNSLLSPRQDGPTEVVPVMPPALPAQKMAVEPVIPAVKPPAPPGM